jgi:hypothetical protein
MSTILPSSEIDISMKTKYKIATHNFITVRNSSLDTYAMEQLQM